MSKEQELKEMLKLYSKRDLWNKIQEKQSMIYDLQSQLAEKEKEIDKYKQTIAEWCGTKFVKSQNQKAIEQLEKLKEICSKQYMFDGYIPQATLKKHIDNQIKQLKEKNND